MVDAAFIARWERKVARAMAIWQRANAEASAWPYPELALRKARIAYRLLDALFRQRDALAR